MERIREICEHCPNWCGGRFEKKGYCCIADDIDMLGVPKDCTLKLEYIVMEQKDEKINKSSLQEV